MLLIFLPHLWTRIILSLLFGQTCLSMSKILVWFEIKSLIQVSSCRKQIYSCGSKNTTSSCFVQHIFLHCSTPGYDVHVHSVIHGVSVPYSSALLVPRAASLRRRPNPPPFGRDASSILFIASAVSSHEADLISSPAQPENVASSPASPVGESSSCRLFRP